MTNTLRGLGCLGCSWAIKHNQIPGVFVIARLACRKTKVLSLFAASRSNLKMKAQLIQKQMGGWVYIMCSLNHSTLYVGVTSKRPRNDEDPAGQ
jgi:hypothetical protein